MRKIILITMFFIIVFIACNSQDNVTNTGKTILKLPERAKVSADLMILRNAIAQYKITNNKYPENLKTLNIKLNLSYEHYIYDPANGNVKSKDYPNL